MRMKSLMTAAEAAGYAMASYDFGVEDDEPVAPVSKSQPILPDAVVPRQTALIPVVPQLHKSLGESLLRNCMSFGALITRRATA